MVSVTIPTPRVAGDTRNVAGAMRECPSPYGALGNAIVGNLIAAFAALTCMFVSARRSFLPE